MKELLLTYFCCMHEVEGSIPTYRVRFPLTKFIHLYFFIIFAVYKQTNPYLRIII
jgi:hypothetical protein